MNYIFFRIAKYIYFYLPEGIKEFVQKKKQKREISKAQIRLKRTKVSKDDVKRIIDSLDIGNCDIILHTSMMNIGKVQGGIKWITKCLFEKIDLTKHTILASALPYRGRFKEYLEKIDVFDVRTAPVEMGGINEYINSLPDTKRSVHPTHSVVAIGKDSEQYVGTHYLDKTPFGVNSPYYKIIKNRGKALMLGATWNHLTCVHAVEDMIGKIFPKAIYSNKIYHVKCLNKNGDSIYVDTPYHDPLLSCIRNIRPLKPKLLKNGIMKIVPIGEAEIAIIDLYRFTLLYLNEIKCGWSIYGRVKISKELESKIDEIIRNL